MKKTLPLYTIVAATFLLLVGDSLFTTGMFIDGLTYSNIAANMAEGIGDMWHPVHSDSIFPHFYEHPTLAMWMLSLFYRVFGTSLWVTRVYAMLIVLITALLILQLWKHNGHGADTGWLPLLLWILVPVVTLSSHCILLECTMAVFVISAVLCMMHNSPRRWSRFLWTALGGLFLFLAFLTKGFTGLYPLAFPLILWLTDTLYPPSGRQKQTLGKAVLQTLVLTVSMSLCVAILFICCPEAWDYLGKYIGHQVIGGMKAPVVDSRWYIIVKFLKQTLIVFAITAVCLIAAWLTRGKGNNTLPSKEDRHTFLTFLLLTLAGVIPIMVSTKQRDFYILTVFPFLAVALGSLLHNAVESWLSRAGRTFNLATTALAVIAVVCAVWLNASYYGKPGRDIALQNDMQLILPCLEEGEHVAIPDCMREEYSLIYYYYREKKISLMPVSDMGDTTLPYRHLLTDGTPTGLEGGHIHKVPLKTERYNLFNLQKHKTTQI